MTKPTKPTAPAVPDRSDRSTFSDRVADFLSYMSGNLATYVSDSNDYIDSESTAAQTAKTNAESAQTAAETARNKAQEWAEKTAGPVEGSEYSAKYHAESAAESAQTALSAPGTNATSTTELTIGTGSKTLAIQIDKDLVEGMFVLISNTGTPANYMAGQITSYNSSTGELIVNVITVGGSGTASAWTVSLSALSFDAASQAEMEAGTEESVRLVSPLRVKQAIDANAEPDLGNPNIDGEVLSSTADGVRSWINMGSMANRDLTISTDEPSGGENGDVWYMVEA